MLTGAVAAPPLRVGDAPECSQGSAANKIIGAMGICKVVRTFNTHFASFWALLGNLKIWKSEIDVVTPWRAAC